MTRYFLLIMFVYCVLSAPVNAAVTATVSAEIKTGEIDDDLRFTNAQGTDNGEFSAYGVLEFETTTLAGTTEIPALQFSLTQANAFFTSNGELSFYHTGDNDTDLTPMGTLRSDPTSVPSAIGAGDLEPLTLLGSGMFTEVESGTIDTYTFAIDDALEATLLSRISSGDPIRFAYAAGEGGTSATYAGVDGDTPPQISIVPEPSSLTALAFGASLIPWLRRRRRS